MVCKRFTKIFFRLEFQLESIYSKTSMSDLQSDIFSTVESLSIIINNYAIILLNELVPSYYEAFSWLPM